MLPFVVFTDKSRPDAETRKFIRSYVMLGKNRRKTPLRSSNDNTVEQACSVPSTGKVLHTQGSRIRAGLPVIPGKVGSDLSTIQFADNVEIGVMETVIRCKRFLHSTPVLVPSQNTASIAYEY
jgi:hypothetical protein